MGETRKSSGRDARAAGPSFWARRVAPILKMKAFFFRKPNFAPLFPGAALAALYSAGGSSGAEVSFGFLLRQSAAAIDRGRALIERRGRELSRALGRTGSDEARLAAWGARLVIALFWVFIGVLLAREASFGLPTRGMSAQSAAMLARILVGVGVLGAAAAMIGGHLARAGGRGADDRFGAEAGAIARDFAEAIAALRARIADEGGAAAADDVSRLHLVAVEAATFLEGVSFLTEADHARAADRFRAFLAARSGGVAGAAGPAAALALLVLGVIVGLAAGRVSGAGGSSGLPLWAVLALPGFALIYGAVGALFAAAGAGPSTLARDEALTRLRKAYVAAGAPRLDDVIADVEAAIAAFRRRIGEDRRPETRAGTDSDARDFASRPAETTPRFVAQTFDATPPVFRPERQEAMRKNFFNGRRRNAEPKQPPARPETPPWLKN